MNVDLEALAGHTLGPWGVDENVPRVIAKDGAGGWPICDMRGWGYLTGEGGLGLRDELARKIQVANAALCAAAPALIAEVRALRARVAELERLGNAMAECQTLGPIERERKDAWRKEVRG